MFTFRHNVKFFLLEKLMLGVPKIIWRMQKMSDTLYIEIIIYTLYNYYLSANKRCPSFKIFRLSSIIFKKGEIQILM